MGRPSNFVLQAGNTIVLSNGANHDVPMPDGPGLCTIAGVTGDFSIDGFAGGADGVIFRILNPFPYVMSLVGGGSGSRPHNQIDSSLDLPGPCEVWVGYSENRQLWVIHRDPGAAVPNILHSAAGATLTPVGGAITVSKSFHAINGGVVSTINGGVANTLYILKAASSYSISSPTNISTRTVAVVTGDALALWFDGSRFIDIWGSSLKLPAGYGLLSDNGAGSDVVGLLFSDGSNLVHLAYYGASGMICPAPNSSFGRVAIPVAHVIAYIGSGQNAAPGTYDLTSADGAGDLVGLACYPTMRLAADDTDHYGAKFWANSVDDGIAHTLANQYGIYVLPGHKGSASTITTQYGVFIAEPTSGVTNYGLYNAGSTFLAKNLGIGAAPSGVYTLWLHLGSGSNLGIVDGVIAVGSNGVFLASRSDDGGTVEPMYYSASLHEFTNGPVRIGTAGAYGALAVTPKTVTLANGVNNDIDIGGAGYIRIVGPTAPFSVTGFLAGIDGQDLDVFNTVAQQMTITDLASSASVNQIDTLTGGNVVQRTGKSFSTYKYDGAISKWILKNSN
jgi:hypothetical protein